MQKIVPHLFFDTDDAKAVAEFYVSIFEDNSSVKDVITIQDTPAGAKNMAVAELLGQEFVVFGMGGFGTFNPSISFMVFCPVKERMDVLWKRLIAGGTALMELGEYPFCERFGWVQDKYGLSWQIMFADESEHTIAPAFMFTGDVYGKAEEAMDFYISVFRGSRKGDVYRHGSDEPYDTEGTVKYAEVTLAGKTFTVTESGYEHNIAFNEAISFMVHCDTQDEIDYYWERLGAEYQQCGWLKDAYGVSWQIIPAMLNEMMKTTDKQKAKRLAEAWLKMTKFDIAVLQEIYQS